MADVEKIAHDTKSWIRYGSQDEDDVCIYRRCPKCGKYIKTGKVFTNMAGEVKLLKWTCKIHGEVEPFYIWD